ncbi:MAG: hypothetical protein ABIH41_01525 [Nanoarchaeota archaeon]
MKPKVLVGCPTSSHKAYVLSEYVAAIKALEYPAECVIADNSERDGYAQRIENLGVRVLRSPHAPSAKDRIVASRNLLREVVLAEGFDFFFCVEQDVLVRPDHLTALLSHGQDIVSGIVMHNAVIDGAQMSMPMVYVAHEDDPTGLRYATADDLRASLVRVMAVSLSCVLISRQVLERIGFRAGPHCFDDMMFCKDALDAGFSIMVDSAVRPDHRPSSWEGLRK